MEAIAVGAFKFLSRVAVVVTQVSQTRIAQLIGTKFAKHLVSRVHRAVTARIAHLIGTISATVTASSTEQARMDKEDQCHQNHHPTQQMLQSFIT